MADEVSEPKELSPFKIIHRGEDSLDSEGEVTFADFSPRVVPADTPEDVVEPAPKGVSAPEPVLSSDSSETPVQPTWENPVQTPASADDGMPSPTGSGSPASSSDPKTG